MKYKKVYEVDPAFLRGGSILWKTTGNGEYIIATKGGKKYFVKRNLHIRYPTKGLSKDAYDKYKAESEAVERKQKKLRALMNGLSWETDHIVVEEENFWDDENMFVTVTSCITDALPDGYDYTALSLEEFLGLAQSVSEALDKLHAHGIIHGDLKGKNIVVTKQKKNYTAYLIDFDSSYPPEAVPDRDPETEEVGGTEGYQSPELLAYGKGLCEKSAITYATDIFSLGVVFHRWWTGRFPGVDLERGTVGAAVYVDAAVTVDSKFDVRIGDNCGATFRSLIYWMFAKDPSERPTARQVKEVLSDALEVPDAFLAGGDEKPFDAELWEAHRQIAELAPVTVLKGIGVRSLKRFNAGCGSLGLKYRVVMKNGKESTMSINELCDGGFAYIKPAEVEAPWEEHRIEFEPLEVIAKKGFAKICRIQQAYHKLYTLTTASGREFDKGYEWLIAEGLAHLKTSEVVADTPWPEHGEKYNHEALARYGVKSITRMEVGGEHRYRIVYDEIVGGKNKVNERVPANNLKLMGFIK